MGQPVVAPEGPQQSLLEYVLSLVSGELPGMHQQLSAVGVDERPERREMPVSRPRFVHHAWCNR